MKELRITLVQNRLDHLFYSGSSVTGSLVVDVDKPKSYKHISIQFLGRAKVHWTERRGGGGGRYGGGGHTVHYTSKEVYVDVTRSLWTADQSPDGCLPPGQHIYTFCFDIPRNAPSSFEGAVGSIRYELHGRIGKGPLKFDHVVHRSVLVQQVVDMSNPRLLQPMRQEVQKTVCCLWCASAPIVLTVAVPKKGYRIGEILPIHVTVENGSSRRISLKASLDQSVVYIAGGKHRTSQKTLLLIRSDEIAPHTPRDWDPALQVPSTEAIDEQSCSNIKMSYTLAITAIVPWGLNLSAKIPLKLGYVQEQPPLEESTRSPPTQPQPQVQPPPYPHVNP